MAFRGTDTATWEIDNVDWDSWGRSITIPDRVDLTNPNPASALDPRFLNRVTPDAKSVFVATRHSKIQQLEQPEEEEEEEESHFSDPHCDNDDDLLCTPHPYTADYGSSHNTSCDSIHFRLPPDEDDSQEQAEKSIDQQLNSGELQPTSLPPSPQQPSRMSINALRKLEAQPKLVVPTFKPTVIADSNATANAFTMPSKASQGHQVQQPQQPVFKPILSNHTTKKQNYNTTTPSKSTLPTPHSPPTTATPVPPYTSRLRRLQAQSQPQHTPRQFPTTTLRSTQTHPIDPQPPSHTHSTTANMHSTPNKKPQTPSRINMTPIPRPAQSTKHPENLTTQTGLKATASTNFATNIHSHPSTTSSAPGTKLAPKSRLNMQPLPTASANRARVAKTNQTKPHGAIQSQPQPLPLPKREIKSKLNLTAIPTASSRPQVKPVQKANSPTTTTTTTKPPTTSSSIFKRQSVLIKSKSTTAGKTSTARSQKSAPTTQTQIASKSTLTTITTTTTPASTSSAQLRSQTRPQSRIAQLMNGNYPTSRQQQQQQRQQRQQQPQSTQFSQPIPLQRQPLAPIQSTSRLNQSTKTHTGLNKPLGFNPKSTSTTSTAPLSNTSVANRVSH